MRPLSTDKKKAKGTHRSNRPEKNLIVPSAITNITAPDELSDEAKKEWNDIAPTLSDDKLLTGLDRKMLMAYCNELAKYFRYTKELETQEAVLELTDKTGTIIVNYRTNPLVDLADKALNQAKSIGVHFGLTPLSRTKITVPVKQEETPESRAKDQLHKLRGKVVQMSKAG